MQSGQLAGLVGSSTSGSANGSGQSGSNAQSNDQNLGAADKTGYQGHALSLVLRGKPADLDEAIRVLSMVDVPAKQLVVEARVAEVSPEDMANLGVDWKWDAFQFTERPNSGAAAGAPGPLGFGSFGRSAFNPIATLNLMVTKKQARILASPHISVLNDQDASIFIGETIRIRVLATSSATAGATYTVYEIPIGIVLLVRPRVNDDGYITARIHPVVSTLLNVPDENNLPHTAAREADTTVRVKDGETLVIGGLIQEIDSKTMSKIPLLGDLPLVGQLFRSQSRDHKRTEVLVFVTIRLAKD
jgi:type II secretory pathway component GspD/PulD (secretin)